MTINTVEYTHDKHEHKRRKEDDRVESFSASTGFGRQAEQEKNPLECSVAGLENSSSQESRRN